MTIFKKSPQGDYFFAYKNGYLAIIHPTMDDPYMWVTHKMVTREELWEKYFTLFTNCEETTRKEYIKAKKLYTYLVDRDFLRL